jgi:methyl-accepting chemotaxis protein
MATLISRAANRTFTLAHLRAQATQLYVILAWLHLPAAAAIALSSGNSWLAPVFVLWAAATIATISAKLLPDGIVLRSIVAVALTMGPIMFGVAGFGNWTLGSDLYFFAVFAMLVGYVDWRPIIISASLTGLYAIVLSVAASSNVFPAEGVDRFLTQAICAFAEIVILVQLSKHAQAVFDRVDDFVDFTMRATAEAIAGHLTDNAALQAELARVRGAA